MSTKEHNVALKMLESINPVCKLHNGMSYSLTRDYLLTLLRQAYLEGEAEGIDACRRVLSNSNPVLKGQSNA